MAARANEPVVVAVDGRRLALSNLDKVLYPRTGFTKGAVIDYYARIAAVLVPHLQGRPVTLVRCPDGVDGEVFFEKRCPPHHPAWLPTGGPQRGCLVEEPATVVWLANLAAIELHTHQWRAGRGDADALVLDLDPGAPAGMAECCEVALALRSALTDLGLAALAKTSGGKGLHVSVPLHSGVETDQAKELARLLGTALARVRPEAVTVTMATSERPGRVFVDWSQNDAKKTTVAPYSLRIGPEPRVSTPVTWEEVEAGATGSTPLAFDPASVLERVERWGDLFAENLRLRQALPG